MMSYVGPVIDFELCLRSLGMASADKSEGSKLIANTLVLVESEVHRLTALDKGIRLKER